MANNPPKLEPWQTKVLNSESALVNDAEFAYWSAALAFDSVVISVFTIALSLSTNRPLISIIIVLSLVSAILLVSNFHSRIQSHRRIMKAYFQDSEKITEELTDGLAVKRQSEMIWIDRRENIAKWLFAVQCLLILLFLIPCW